jgi:hypothetical protein
MGKPMLIPFHFIEAFYTFETIFITCRMFNKEQTLILYPLIFLHNLQMGLTEKSNGI